jgi:hypothetical protein
MIVLALNASCGSHASLLTSATHGITEKLARNFIESQNPARDNDENSRRKLQNVVTDSTACHLGIGL